jgi:hypothetical protein
MPRVYDFFGLGLAADDELPCLQPANGANIDVEVEHLGLSDMLLIPPPPVWRIFRSDANGWLLQYAGLTGEWSAFQYAAAQRRMIVAGTARWTDLSAVLLGPVAAALLRGLGIAVLHGATVARGDRAIALLGASGVGKSSLAARLLATGWAPVSDDLAVLRQRGNDVLVTPGPPLLSLHPESCALVGAAAATMPRPDGVKVWLDTRPWRTGHHKPFRLVAAFILDQRQAGLARPTTTSLQPRDALLGLVRQTYGTSWLGPPDHATLKICGAIADRCKVTRMTLPDTFASLDAAAARVREVAEA